MTENWLGIPGYSPPTINDPDELRPICLDVLSIVRGSRIERICAAYDLRCDCWDFDMPILIAANGHCIDIVNNKFDCVSIGIDRIPPELKTNWNWWDGDDWVKAYRDYPTESILGRRISNIRPCIEDNPQYMNYGDLNGVSITMDNALLKIVNGLDTNVIIICGTDGTIVREYVEHRS